MYKIGFLISNSVTTNYYKYLFDSLNTNKDIDISWVNLNCNQTIIKRKKKYTTKIIDFLLSKILRFISKLERVRSQYSDNLHFLNTFYVESLNIDLSYDCTITIPSNRISLTSDSILKFKEKKYDLLIRAGSGILDSKFFNVSTYGIISLHLGDNRKIRGSVPGFYESLYKTDEIGFIIQRISEKLDGGEILYRANYPAKKRWNDNHLFIIGLSYEAYLRTIINTVKRKNIYFECNIPYFDRLNSAPTVVSTCKYIFQLFADTIKDNWVFYFKKHPSWHIHYTKGNWDDATFYNGKVIENRLNSFFADPFPIEINGEIYLFVEEYLIEEKKGVISVLKYQDSNFIYLGVVLDLNYHISFPYIYQVGSDIFMIPEQSQSGFIAIYKAIDFPLKWTLVKKLIEDVDAADTTVFYYNNLYWLFSNIDTTSSGIHSSEIHIFYSDSLLSDSWIPHPQNSVQEITPFGKRNASQIFFKNDKLYRFGQIQGNSFYGKGLALFEVELNKHNYSEKLIKDFTPNFSSRIKGMHHISTTGKMTFIDCFY
jgi:hypothetical protein